MISIKLFALVLLLLVVFGGVNAQGLVINNPGFELSTNIKDKPDYWTPRYIQDHFVETAPANIYEGKQSALFTNNSGKSVEGYFYGPADISGQLLSIDVVPGDIYTFSAWCRVASDFSGAGLKVCLLFSKDGAYVSRVDSTPVAPKKWTRRSVQATVPDGANRMTYSVEYSGLRNAWFDKVELVRGSIENPEEVDLSYYQKQNVLIGYPQLISKADITRLMKSKTAFDDLKNNMRMVSWTFGKLTPEAADSVVKKLKSQGINIILSAGNRFITTNLEENIEKSAIIADACHKNGIKFAHHVTTTLVKQSYYQSHPDFTCVNIATGKPHYEATYDFATACLNNDNYWHDYMQRLEKLFANVKLDGIMVDEIEYWGDTLCGCDWCRRKFRADTGLELPTSDDQNFFRNLNNSTYKRWLSWRASKLQERNLDIRALMKKYMPNGGFYPSYLCNPTYTGMWNAYFQNGMQLDAQVAYSSSVGIEYEPRFFNNYYNWPVAVVEMKFEKAVNRVLDSNPWIYFYPTQYGDYIWQWNLSMALGFNIWFPGEQAPEKNVEKARSALTGWMAKYQKLIGKTSAYANTGIVYSTNTRDLCPEGTEWREGFFGVSQLLTDSHTSYQMLVDRDLTNRELLKGFRTLVMFNTVCLSDRAVATIREFVRNGGTLLASSNISLRDENGNMRNDFGLADVLGVSYASYQENAYNNMVFPAKGKDRIPGISGSYKHDKGFVNLKSIDSKRRVLARIVDTEGKEYLGVIAGSFGKGSVIYFAGHPEMHYIRADHLPPYYIAPGQMWQSSMDTDYQQIITKTVNYLNPKPALIVKNLPTGVIAEALEHKTGDVTGISVHLINCSGAVLKDGIVPKIFEVKFPAITPKGGIDVALRADNIKKVYLLSPDYNRITELKPVFNKGYVKVNIPALYRSAMLYFVRKGAEHITAINNGKITTQIPKPCKMIVESYIPPVGKYDPKNIVFFADSAAYVGGYVNDRDIGLLNRNLFGTGASSNSLSVTFSLPKPAKKLGIEFYGNEFITPGQKLPLKVTLNGKVIFEGENLLENIKLSSKTFDIPAAGFTQNGNKLEVFNLSGSTVWDSPYLRLYYIKVVPEY